MFDVRTIVLVFLLVLYLCAYQMALTFSVSKRHFRGMGYFLGHFALSALGMTLGIMRPALPSLITVVAANALMFLGALSLVFGAAAFTRLRASRRLYAAYLLFFLLGYLYLDSASVGVNLRIVFFSLMAVPVYAHAAFIFVVRGKDDRQYCIKSGGVCALVALVYMLRAGYAACADAVPHYFASSHVEAVMITLILLLSAALAFSINLMITTRLLQEAAEQAEIRERLLAKTELLATRDHLTGLYNRRFMEDMLRAEIEKSKRYGDELSVILCDIDRFKAVNDDLGHDVGDEALVHVTRLLGDGVREVDRVGRWGGEEFIVATPHTGLDRAALMAERFRAGSEACPPDVFPAGRVLTLSFGVAQYEPGMSLSGFVKSADEALYQAKQEGRNRVVCAEASPRGPLQGTSADVMPGGDGKKGGEGETGSG